MTDRRAFLKSLLGIAAVSALPVPLEALAETVALPGEAEAYTLSFFIKPAAGVYLPWAVNAAQLKALSASGGWARISIPFRAGTAPDAVAKAAALLRGVVGELRMIQLEIGGQSLPIPAKGLGPRAVVGI